MVSSGLGDPIAWVRGQFSGEYTNPLSKEALLMEEDRQNAAFQVAMAGMGALTRLIATAKTITEGIYEFVASSGKTYVGQSGNIPARLLRHIRSGKLVEGTAVKTKEVLGGKTVREIAEHRRIDKLGGIDKLENIRYPIGPNRQYLLQ